MGQLDLSKVFGDERFQQIATAIARGDLAAVQTMQARKQIDWKVVGNKGLTLGHVALHAPDPKVLEWVIRQGADPVARLADGNTIPHYALGKNDAQGKRTDAWLAVLLDYGVSPDLTGPADLPLVISAVGYGNLPAIELLAKRGANMSQMSKWKDGTAIHFALTANDLSLAARLADLGSDPRVKDDYGLDAADRYCRLNHGRYGPARLPEFERMRGAFSRYGLDIPCGF